MVSTGARATRNLLKFVGKPGYRDPACDFKDAAPPAGDPPGHRNGREDSCNLAFGTSTGALGFRKFPNPRFDPVAWKKLNGRLGTWEGYDRTLSSDPARSDFKVRKLADGSIEPPFLIGTACASCHVAFNPAKPPLDPAHPKWENISGLVGNQYIRISEVLVSGMPKSDLLWQVFSHARPGTSDTSADSQRPGQQRGHHQRADQHRRAPHLRRREGQPLAQGGRLPGRCEGIHLLVRTRQARQVLGKKPADRDRAPHPQGRRRLDRRAGRHPARVLQHRLVRRAVLGQPPYRPAPARSAGAQLRPDAVRHRPVPARLPQLPCHRGPPAEHPRFLPDRARRPRQGPARGTPEPASGQPSGTGLFRSQSGERPGKNLRQGIGDARTAGLRRQLRPLPFQQQAAFRSGGLPRHRQQDRPARRLARQRRPHAGHRNRHRPLPRAALQPHARAISGTSSPTRTTIPGRWCRASSNRTTAGAAITATSRC